MLHSPVSTRGVRVKTTMNLQPQTVAHKAFRFEFTRNLTVTAPGGHAEQNRLIQRYRLLKGLKPLP
jgi:hypothetical protein